MGSVGLSAKRLRRKDPSRDRAFAARTAVPLSTVAAERVSQGPARPQALLRPDSHLALGRSLGGRCPGSCCVGSSWGLKDDQSGRRRRRLQGGEGGPREIYLTKQRLNGSSETWVSMR